MPIAKDNKHRWSRNMREDESREIKERYGSQARLRQHK